MDFINRHYVSNGDGCWCVHNGPQKVFATLEYTPWVWHIQDGRLLAHTGIEAGAPTAVWLDESGNLLMVTSLGIGLLNDRDLPAIIPSFCNAQGVTLDSEALEALCRGKLPDGGAGITWNGKLLSLEIISSAQVAIQFGFNPSPRDPSVPASA